MPQESGVNECGLEADVMNAPPPCPVIFLFLAPLFSNSFVFPSFPSVIRAIIVAKAAEMGYAADGLVSCH